MVSAPPAHAAPVGPLQHSSSPISITNPQIAENNGSVHTLSVVLGASSLQPVINKQGSTKHNESSLGASWWPKITDEGAVGRTSIRKKEKRLWIRPQSKKVLLLRQDCSERGTPPVISGCLLGRCVKK
jgi:hypothetical protein